MKPYEKMTAAELARVTRQFNRGADVPAVKPPPNERAKHERARKRGRPSLGLEETVRVLFTIQPAILRQIDRFAKRKGIKRSQFITAAALAFMEGDKRRQEVKKIISNASRRSGTLSKVPA
jgi:hypothetical protein